MITLPPDWRQVDSSHEPNIEFCAHGPVTEYGYAPALIIRRLPNLEGRPEASMSAMLEGAAMIQGGAMLPGGMRDDPMRRFIDVGETTLAGRPAVVAVYTDCAERKSLTQLFYFFTSPDEPPSAYALTLIAATPDFGPMAGVFADMVASFRPEGIF